MSLTYLQTQVCEIHADFPPSYAQTNKKNKTKINKETKKGNEVTTDMASPRGGIYYAPGP